MTEEIKIKNFGNYKKYLCNLITEVGFNRLMEQVGGEEMVFNASFGMNKESGSAYDGALVENMISIAENAVKINDILPENMRVSKASIYKVALLSHISKAVMYETNTNTWEINNRGILYKFKENEASLRSGERSIMICMNAGITFTESEFEAMRIIDKINEGDDAARWYSTTLSMLIRQANEIITCINKKKS